jgi:hypothetical protein
MPRTLQMKQHNSVILTLRSDLSLYDGSVIYRVEHSPSGNSRQVMTICKRMERAHRFGDWKRWDGRGYDFPEQRL